MVQVQLQNWRHLTQIAINDVRLVTYLIEVCGWSKAAHVALTEALLRLDTLLGLAGAEAVSESLRQRVSQCLVRFQTASMVSWPLLVTRVNYLISQLCQALCLPLQTGDLLYADLGTGFFHWLLLGKKASHHFQMKQGATDITQKSLVKSIWRWSFQYWQGGYPETGLLLPLGRSLVPGIGVVSRVGWHILQQLHGGATGKSLAEAASSICSVATEVQAEAMQQLLARMYKKSGYLCLTEMRYSQRIVHCFESEGVSGSMVTASAGKQISALVF